MEEYMDAVRLPSSLSYESYAQFKETRERVQQFLQRYESDAPREFRVRTMFEHIAAKNVEDSFIRRLYYGREDLNEVITFVESYFTSWVREEDPMKSPLHVYSHLRRLDFISLNEAICLIHCRYGLEMHLPERRKIDELKSESVVITRPPGLYPDEEETQKRSPWKFIVIFVATRAVEIQSEYLLRAILTERFDCFAVDASSPLDDVHARFLTTLFANENAKLLRVAYECTKDTAPTQPFCYTPPEGIFFTSPPLDLAHVKLRANFLRDRCDIENDVFIELIQKNQLGKKSGLEVRQWLVEGVRGSNPFMVFEKWLLQSAPKNGATHLEFGRVGS